MNRRIAPLGGQRFGRRLASAMTSRVARTFPEVRVSGCLTDPASGVSFTLARQETPMWMGDRT